MLTFFPSAHPFGYNFPPYNQTVSEGSWYTGNNGKMRGEHSCFDLILYLTTVDTKMLFEVVFVLECFPTLQTFELPGFHSWIQSDATLG